jgi:phosphopantothenoylcysteine decarboxylase
VWFHHPLDYTHTENVWHEDVPPVVFLKEVDEVVWDRPLSYSVSDNHEIQEGKILMKHILLGVTASVAAVKVLKLAELLVPSYQIKIIVTEQAGYFVKPDYPRLADWNIAIYKDQDEWPPLAQQHYSVGSPILHIELRRWADYLLIAPLDANTLAKIAHGFCDNLLTSVVRAWDWTKPMLLCPAMNTLMWENPPTSQHVALLKTWGAGFIEPIEKKLACNDIGMGAMASVEEIIKIVKNQLA